MYELLQDAAQTLAQVGEAASSVPHAARDALASAAGAAMHTSGVMDFIARSDWVGKSLFAILLIMSLITWYLIFVKLFMGMRNRRHSAHFLEAFWADAPTQQMEVAIRPEEAAEPFARLAARAVRARDFLAARDVPAQGASESDAAMLTRAMRQSIEEDTARLEGGLTALASIGSTAPFVGLLGTVWGVYHALVGIGLTNDVTISGIAGPVGEALIMTGLGLAVAIPAVLAYNAFVRRNRVYLARLDAFAHDLFTLLVTGRPFNRARPQGADAAPGGKER
ncbi:MAG: MotA/TolQ/ExbB proton channel family protein [Candidimonas sp.]|nr:MAG: MotA/TolQ/ExbB proton channel family protein [Candidimonas sp.]